MATLKSVRWAWPCASSSMLSGLMSLRADMRTGEEDVMENGPVYYFLTMEVIKCRGKFGYPESNDFLREGGLAIQVNWGNFLMFK